MDHVITPGNEVIETQLVITCFKVNNKNTRTRCEICSKLLFIVNFEHISHFVLVFLMLTLSK